MSTRILLVILLVIPVMASAKDKVVPLPESAVAALSGKSFVVTRHDKAGFTAMTAGKAAFGLFGAGAMISAGNKIVADNAIGDPADILERELAPAVAKQYGLQLKAGPSPVIKASKPKEIAATQPDVDYVLDVESTGWMFAYYATDWDKYWVGYSAHVKFIERASGKLIADAFCNATTNKHAASPSKDSLLENNAQLLKDVTTAQGWACVHVLAKEQFRLPDGVATPTPAEYADPLTAYAQAKGSAVPATPAAAEAAAVPAAN
ncbi:MAG TPA: hypothetical protein VIV63_15950 [Steroidobacteraceae bacterium]